MKIVSVGEILWDVFESAEHLGGAAFNFAAHAARLGHDVAFVSAVGDDERGRRALERTRQLGLSTRFIGIAKGKETGIATVRLSPDGQPAFVIVRPAAYDFVEPDGTCRAALAAMQDGWLYYGTLFQTQPRPKAVTLGLASGFPKERRFYDVNLRVNSYDSNLVRELLALAGVVKLNDSEVTEIRRMFEWEDGGGEDFCRRLAAEFGLTTVCVTRGAEGCAALSAGRWTESPGYPAKVVDTVGAGDAFSAAFVHGLGAGWTPEATADFANRVGALIAGRAGGTPEWRPEEVATMRGF